MDVLARNIAALVEEKRRQELEKPRAVRIADRVTRFIGSLRFVLLQTVAVVAWCAVNELWLRMDPFPYPMLTFLLSVEAIYLTAFVLISQNRMSAVADERAEADLTINLLDEKETTRILRIVDAIARKVGADIERDEELESLEKDVEPEDILRRIELDERRHRT